MYVPELVPCFYLIRLLNDDIAITMTPKKSPIWWSICVLLVDCSPG